MQAFLLSKWVIKHLERLKQAFFWKGKEKYLSEHCLVTWSKVCLPTIHGGWESET
jgi:hypothetical protein